MKQQLTVDVLEEILSRLRVKELLRFKSVSKQWLLIISTPVFVQLHLKKSISNPRIFVPDSDTYKIMDCTNSEDVSCTELPRPKETVATFIGTCDGLICFLDYSYTKAISLCLWNPALRAFRNMNLNIPMRGLMSRILFSWFGRGDSDEYKLVIGIRFISAEGVKSTRVHAIRLYAQVDESDYYCYYDQPIIENGHKLQWRKEEPAILLNGVVHWLACGGTGNCFVYFWYDLARNTVGEMPIYWETQSLLCSIGVIDGCLAAIWTNFFNFENTFWIMKEYGVKESWTKLMTISWDHLSSLNLIGVANNGDFIMLTGPSNDVLIYNVAENKCKTLLASVPSCPTMYLETLISP